MEIKPFLKKQWPIIFGVVVIFACAGGIEFLTGRSLLGPDGQFGWWSGDIWNSDNSQRVADAYSFSHIIHGILFYAFFWLVARKAPLRYRLLLSVLVEAGWELLENSPLIINRYREATIALGYVGDSVLNSMADIGMAAAGFAIAYFSKPWFSTFLVIVLELGCLLWIRDNLTLNVIMLVHPIEAIKIWQSALR